MLFNQKICKFFDNKLYLGVVLKFPDKTELIKRENNDVITKQYLSLSNNKLLSNLLGTINLPVCIINDKRQVVFANLKAAEFYGAGLEDLLGRRHGECLNCVNSKKGCGVSDACEFCGAFNAIMETIIEGEANEQECRILSQNNDKVVAHDLNVKSSPLVIDDSNYLLIILEDISSEKRKKSLERIFFHDVLNTISSMNGLVNYMACKNFDDETDEIMQDMVTLTNRLTEEVLEQRDLIAAENGELKIRCTSINTLLLLNNLIKQAEFLTTNKSLNFEIIDNTCEIDFISDITILRRILFNMIKNAAEAEKYKGDIYLGCKKTENEEILFYVKNKSYIEPETQTLIFQRNFSTKSVSRGLGTFSMKLLTENYLEGKVFFKSIKNEGTTFYLQIPLNRLKCEEYNE